MWNEAEAYRMPREGAGNSNPEESPKDNSAESHTGEPVEELEKKQEQYEVWSSPFEFQKTLEYLTDGENQNQKKSLDMFLIDMGEDEAKMIGEAVASHPSLEVLTIVLDFVHEEEEKLSSPTSMWPMDSFLKAAFLGEKRNTSILSVFIAGSETDGCAMRLGLLPQVLRENTHIRQFAIRWQGDDGTSHEELQDLFDAIQGNSTIQSLALPAVRLFYVDSDAFKQLLKIVEHNTSIQKLELHIGEFFPNDDVDLFDDFYIALNSNSTIRILHLNGLFYTEVAELEFSEWIATTVTLRELHLDGGSCQYVEICESEFLKVLFEALQENESLRKLKLDRFSCVDDDDVFKELLNAIEENSTLQEIEFDPAPNREEEVREALKKNVH